MTKEEKIKECYGQYYEFIKNHLDENGWVDTQTFSCSRKGIEFDQYKKRSNTYLGFYNRPKSLRGIENNNGWIKIESDGDLPKENADYYVIHEGSVNVFSDADKADFKLWLEIYSHYQKIIKPALPLY